MALLADGRPRSAGDIAQAIGAAKLSHLLTAMVGKGLLRRVAHGLYRRAEDGEPGDGPPEPPFRVRILLLIAALGEARSRDITLLTGYGRRRNRGAGVANHLARLKADGLIAAKSTTGRQPFYALSATGHAFVRGRDIPDGEALRGHLDQALKAFKEEGASKASAGRMVETWNHIRALLAKRPHSTAELIAARPELFTNPTSIHVALKVLCARGEVRKIAEARGRRPAVWARVQAPAGGGRREAGRAPVRRISAAE